jgi:hypothetical protein
MPLEPGQAATVERVETDGRRCLLERTMNKGKGRG